jgi:perosamine synthetase
MDRVVSEITEVLNEVLSPSGSFIPLHIPEFDKSEEQLLIECVQSNFVSSVGSFVDRFEEVLQSFTGAKRVILCVNGTSALHLALKLADVQQGDEVLMPSFTFVATANALSYCGAVPHFIDIEESHLGIDPAKLKHYLEMEFNYDGKIVVNPKTGSRVKAILPMHSFGHPCKMSELSVISELYNLPLIEDAAESLGSFYKGKHTGSLGLCGVLSFNGNKIITTGGGGAILTDNLDLADRAKHLSTTAKIPHRWLFEHDAMGFNYRMPALNAALGCGQMEKLPNMLLRKRRLAECYKSAFEGLSGVRFISERKDSESNYWLNTLVLQDGSGQTLEKLLEATNNAEIMTRPAWTPLHLLPIYKNCPKMDLSITENIYRRVINIPSSAYLYKKD